MKIKEEDKRFIRIYLDVMKGQLYIYVMNSVGENLTLQPKEKIDRDKAREALKQAGIWEVFQEKGIGLDDYMTRYFMEDGIELSGGQIQRFMLASTRFSDQMVQRQLSSLELLKLPDEMYKGKLPVEKRSDFEYEVEFEHVWFRYPGAKDWALQDFSFKLKVGKKLAIVGMNSWYRMKRANIMSFDRPRPSITNKIKL